MAYLWSRLRERKNIDAKVAKDALLPNIRRKTVVSWPVNSECYWRNFTKCKMHLVRVTKELSEFRKVGVRVNS